MSVRTDLAVESTENICDGMTRKERGEAFKITEITIDSDECAEKTGKRCGRYVTLEGRSLSMFSADVRAMCREFADELSAFIPGGTVLVAGLGNSDITPDALGPKTVSKIFATRHLMTELSDEADFLSELRPVAAVASGVLGQTGIESAELIKTAAAKIQPSCVIAVDALACSGAERLGRTIQLSDTGISPGSGVQNRRMELSAETIGVPVIAVGMPTVIDMKTIVSSYTEAAADIPEMMVTPRDIDKLISRASSVIATGINLALQPSLSLEELESIMW